MNNKYLYAVILLSTINIYGFWEGKCTPKKDTPKKTPSLQKGYQAIDIDNNKQKTLHLLEKIHEYFSSNDRDQRCDQTYADTAMSISHAIHYESRCFANHYLFQFNNDKERVINAYEKISKTDIQYCSKINTVLLIVLGKIAKERPELLRPTF